MMLCLIPTAFFAFGLLASRAPPLLTAVSYRLSTVGYASSGVCPPLAGALSWLFRLTGGRTTRTSGTYVRSSSICIHPRNPWLRILSRISNFEFRAFSHWFTTYESAAFFRPAVSYAAFVAFFFTSAHSSYAGVGSPDYTPVFYYYHADHLGSGTVITDRDGDIVQVYKNSLFGRQTHQDNSSAEPLTNRYTDQAFDADTGLYYYNARYYDPELGRFIQADSIVPDPSSSQSYNRYSYVINNPLNLTDPSGHSYVTGHDGSGNFFGYNSGGGGGSSGSSSSGSSSGGVTWTFGPSYISFGDFGNPMRASSSSSNDEDEDEEPSAQAAAAAAAQLAAAQAAAARQKAIDEAKQLVENLTELGVGLGQGLVGAVVGGAVVGGLLAINAPIITGAVIVGGIGLAGYSLYQWAQNDFAITYRGVGQFIGGLAGGGIGARAGQAFTTGFRSALSQAAAKGIPKVTPQGIARIEQHLGRAELQAVDDPLNKIMIDRLKAGQTTTQDLNFYMHELKESALMNRGIGARDAHLQTLEWQGIPYMKGYESQLYAPEAFNLLNPGF